MASFAGRLEGLGIRLERRVPEILQVNLGRYCNMTCVHCHVEAGPSRREDMMEEATALAVVRLMEAVRFRSLDLTGGAPEMNPHFRMLVDAGCRAGLEVLDRCNLTVFFEPGYEDLPEYLASRRVTVVASLPCYSSANVDLQRGRGAFELSIRALRILNGLGYGREESGLRLDLVYNPAGAHLPPPQKSLEAEYRKRLREDFAVEFTRLLTITNMPITRYASYLKARGEYEGYVRLLEERFNPSALEALMCRDTLSVDSDGRIYDCDFNQMLGIPAGGRAGTVADIERIASLEGAPVAAADHCYGCTAGSGSGCGGALVGNGGKA